MSTIDMTSESGSYHNGNCWQHGFDPCANVKKYCDLSDANGIYMKPKSHPSWGTLPWASWCPLWGLNGLIGRDSRVDEVKVV